MELRERNHHLHSDRCTLCGNLYGHFKSDNSSSPLRKTVHHQHIPLTQVLSDESTLSGGQKSLSICNVCNIHIVTRISNKVALCFHSANGSQFDHLLIGKAVILYGRTLFPVLGENGEIVGHKPLIKRNTQLLLKGAESLMTIKFHFHCHDALCEGCAWNKSKNKMKKNLFSRQRIAGRLITPACIYGRGISFMDFTLLVPASLSGLVSDLEYTTKAENKTIRETFKHTFAFGKKLGLTDIDAEKFSTQKISMPFALFQNGANFMQSITQPPDRRWFKSDLANTGLEVGETEYQNFLWSWHIFSCQNLLHLCAIYIAADW